MAQLNVGRTRPAQFTAEGGTADFITPLQQLRRSVMSCLLWEDEFYEDGKAIADRINTLAEQVTPLELSHLAVEARNRFHLRHVPLLLLVKLAKTGSGTPILKDTIPQVIRRADELAEFCALFWKFNPGKDITNQMKKGLRLAFMRFDEYQLAKYDRDKPVKMRDVAFLAHVKGTDKDKERLIARGVNKNFFPEATKSSGYPVRAMFETPDEKPGLDSPDTWEVALSAGGDKKTVFEQMIRDDKLPYFALIRNLRNMAQSGCDADLVKGAILARKGAGRILPFRYIAAARAAVQFEKELDQAMLGAIQDMPRMMGNTVVLSDVSQSMDAKLSGKSDLKRRDASAALASMVPCDSVRCFTFSNTLVEVPARKGMAGVDAIERSQAHSGTYLVEAMNALHTVCPKYDRLIVVTDEQMFRGNLPTPRGRFNYMVNVASNQNGIGYRKPWTHIDGFSEAIFRYITEVEGESPLNSMRN